MIHNEINGVEYSRSVEIVDERNILSNVTLQVSVTKTNSMGMVFLHSTFQFSLQNLGCSKVQK